MLRRKTRLVKVGNLTLGGANPIRVQGMTKTNTEDVSATLRQIKRLESAGCEIVRVAVPNMESAKAIVRIKPSLKIPIVADIHFDYRLALAAMENGADKIRINPGNIRDFNKLSQILNSARKKRISIRIGVNSGSLHTTSDIASGMVKSALNYIKFFEKEEFFDLVISLKASDVPVTIRAYRLMAKECSYPFHLGVTAAGLPEDAITKSCVGIGTLLAEGIGDTIRVSLTGDPVQEVEAARRILTSLGLSHNGPEIISCPTCGRCEINLIRIAKDIEKGLKELNTPEGYLQNRKFAIMGCVVNGPGEAKEADLGIAGGRGFGIIFKEGRLLKKVREKDLVKEFLKEAEKLGTVPDLRTKQSES